MSYTGAVRALVVVTRTLTRLDQVVTGTADAEVLALAAEDVVVALATADVVLAALTHE